MSGYKYPLEIIEKIIKINGLIKKEEEAKIWVNRGTYSCYICGTDSPSALYSILLDSGITGSWVVMKKYLEYRCRSRDLGHRRHEIWPEELSIEEKLEKRLMEAKIKQIELYMDMNITSWKLKSIKKKTALTGRQVEETRIKIEETGRQVEETRIQVNDVGLRIQEEKRINENMQAQCVDMLKRIEETLKLSSIPL